MEAEPKPRRRPLVRYLCSAASLVAVAGFSYRPSGTGQLLSALTVLLAYGSGIVGLWWIRRQRWRGALATAFCFVAAPMGTWLGNRLADIDFYHRRLARYEAAVARIESGEVKLGPEAERLYLVDVSDLADVVWAVRGETGGLRVEFFWGGGFPVKHTAYIYTSTGHPEFAEMGSWHYRRLNDHWFEAGD